MAFVSLKKQWRLVSQIAIDVILINLGFALAYWVRYTLEWPFPVAAENYIPYASYLPMKAILTVLLLVVFGFQKVYLQQRGRNWVDQALALVNGTATGVMLTIVLTYFVPELSYSRGLLPLAAMTIVFLLTLSRIANNVILDQLRKRGVGVKQVLGAAALTYVAGVASSAGYLLFLLLVAGKWLFRRPPVTPAGP